MSTIDDIASQVKNDNPKKYVDLYNIGESDPYDPLAKVVPSTDSDFFGTYALNFLVFPSLFMNGSHQFDSEYDASKAQLIATYDKFAKYELHIYIDGTSDDIGSASESDLNDFKDLLEGLANDLSSYGVVYHGQIDDAGELSLSINQVIADFIQDT